MRSQPPYFSSRQISFHQILSLLGLIILLFLLNSCQTPVVEKPPAQTTPPAVAKPATSTLREKALSESKGNVRIAILLPLSGPQAYIGHSLLNAAQMSVFDNTDDRFELLIHDTKGDATHAAQAAQKALDEGAQIILGPLFSQETQGVAPLAIKYGVPVISFSNNRDIAGRGIFLMGFDPGEQVQRLISVASSHGLKRIAALIPATPYGQVLKRELQKQAKKGSVTLTALITYNPGTTDFTSQAHKIKISQPQALLIPEGSEQLHLVVSSLLYSDLDLHQIKLLGTGQWDTPEITTNEAVIGGWFVASPPESRQRFEQTYKAAYNEAPPRLATLAYDAVSLTAVLARNQKSHPYDITLLTQPLGFAGIDGLFRLRPDGTVERKLAILEVTGHGLQTLSPAATGF